MNILVADGDADTRQLYCESLTHSGCKVVEAPDGREALVMALEQPPDAVITELWLPLVDGYGLCDVFRHDDRTRHVPILVVTSEARPAQLERARSAGANDILVKPLGMDVLVQRVRALIESTNNQMTSSTADIQQTRQLIGRMSKTIAGSRKRQDSSRRQIDAFRQRREPALQPPVLPCPQCDRLLTHISSHVGGTKRNVEQWDYYLCSFCGRFQYRHRTRKLRKVS